MVQMSHIETVIEGKKYRYARLERSSMTSPEFSVFVFAT